MRCFRGVVIYLSVYHVPLHITVSVLVIHLRPSVLYIFPGDVTDCFTGKAGKGKVWYPQFRYTLLAKEKQ